MTELPLPLTALKGGHIVDPNGWTVAQCYGDYSEEYSALIVAAVHSHAALLEAAKRAVLVMKDTRILGVAGKIDIGIEDLQSAIAAAEESAS